MNIRDTVEKIILRYPICEYCFGGTDQLPFSDQIPLICARDCKNYGKSWACPPYSGSLSKARERCGRYEAYCLFSTVTQRDPTWDDEDALKVRFQHEKITRQIRQDLEKIAPDCLFLSTGCTVCEICSCPDSPCRFPDRRISPIESQGILAVRLADAGGLTLQYDSDTIVYFSLILFHEAVHDNQDQ